MSINMKSLIIRVLVFIAFTATFLSCKKMDSTYRQFIESGKITYPQKAVKAVIYTGRNRVKIMWLKGTDPSVTSAKIFWNNYTDSLDVPIPPGADTISTIVNNLVEQSYSFNIKTYDTKGNASVPVELLSAAYGERYQDGLLPRPVNRIELDSLGTLTVNWGNADISGGAYATEITYTSNTNQVLNKRFLVSDSVSMVAGVKKGTTIQYRTLFLPDLLSIDTFYTPAITENISAKIPKAGLSVTADSYAATSQLPSGGPPQFAFDDDINTFWHTHHTPAPVPPFPHWLAVDLAKTYYVTRVELTCRPNVTNTFTDFTIQGSMDGTNWISYNSFTLVQQNPTQSFVLTGTPKMKYIRIYATKGPNAYANLAEFTVYGYE